MKFCLLVDKEASCLNTCATVAILLKIEKQYDILTLMVSFLGCTEIFLWWEINLWS